MFHFGTFPDSRTGSQCCTATSAATLNKTGSALYVDVARNVQERFRNHCCSGKAIRITYSECVFVSLGIQHAMSMRHIVICDLPGSSTLSHKRYDFRRSKTLYTKCYFFYFLYKFVWNIFHHHHHLMSVMELGHLLTRSGLTYLEVSSEVCHDSFCQLGNSVSLSWVVCREAFCLHVVSSSSCVPVVTFFILWIIQRDMITNVQYTGLHVKYR